MEYTSINDFYLKLKAIYNKNGSFIDYVLIYLSENFHKATGMNPESILDKKVSEIVVDIDNRLGLKDYYFNMIPKMKSKYSLYIKELKRWYLINMFDDKNDKEEYLIIFYNDVTDIRKNSHQQSILTNGSADNIYNLKDEAILYYRDKLTGLYNKGFFEEELSRLDTKRQLPISIIMGDINGLKLINDAFGHSMGDKVLKKVADIMVNSFRKEDIISRIGGDEFVAILPKTSEETSLSIIDRINSDCEKKHLDFIKISISFGVATKETEDEDVHEIFKKAEERMYFKKLRESKAAKQSMINFLKKKLEKITFETKAHYERLKELSLMMADKLGLSEMEKEKLSLLCEFHDIGKIGIRKQILQKQGYLNEVEWEDIKRHSEIGYNIIKEFRETLPIDELILNHHERWDGKGYPGLLEGKDIPIEARIFAIADAYEAMVNDRPYKNIMNNKQALKEILDKSGSQFDPALGKIFVDIMDKQELIV